MCYVQDPPEGVVDQVCDPWEVGSTPDWTMDGLTSGSTRSRTSAEATAIPPTTTTKAGALSTLSEELPSSLVSSTKKRLSPSKSRRSRAEHPVPSLDDEVKQQLLSQAWSLPPYVSQPVQPTFFQISVTSGNLSNFRHAETSTSTADMVALQRIQQGLQPHNTAVYIKILTCRPREIAQDGDVPSAGPSNKHGMIAVDQSSSTEDLGSESAVDGIGFLGSCFPTVATDDLRDILQQCQGHVEWAVNIMLDAGYEYNDPNHHVADNSPQERPGANSLATESISTGNISETADRPGMVTSPSSLLGMCHISLQCKQDLASRDVLETVTQANMQRLKSIEEFKRSRSCHSDCLEDQLETSGQSVPSLDLSTDVFSALYIPNIRSPVSRTSRSALQQEGDVLVEETWVEGEEEEEVVAVGGEREREQEEGSRLLQKDDLALTLSPQLATQLIQMFGPVGFHISPGTLFHLNSVIILEGWGGKCVCLIKYHAS